MREKNNVLNNLAKIFSCAIRANELGSLRIKENNKHIPADRS